MSYHHSSGLIVGIDAANMLGGGGLTQLIEILAVVEPEKYGIQKIVIWGGAQTLAKIHDRPWLEKISPSALNRALLRRILWQLFRLTNAAYSNKCHVLWIPGGSFAGRFRPFVAVSLNLLPFEWQELRRYGFSLLLFKFILLRYSQSRSFCRADGVIFLTEYAKRIVTKITGSLVGHVKTIPFGVNHRFLMQPKTQFAIKEYTQSNPYRLIYVSFIGPYKHQWNVVEAIYLLRKEGYPIVLDLVGSPDHFPSSKRLHKIISRLDPQDCWVHNHGAVSHEILHQFYRRADLGIFASSCENLPNILLETMASGLPVASSNRGPMPEVLGDAGLYFDPENPTDIAQVIRKFILSPELRAEKALASFERCQQYSWERCAEETFAFLVEVTRGLHE